MKLKMTMLKPGSIVLTKKYGVLAKIKAFFTGKTLPYNRFFLNKDADCNIMFDASYSTLYLVLNRQYNKRELAELASFTKAINGTATAKGISSESVSFQELFVIINAIRPNTLNAPFTAETILTSRYYKLADINDIDNVDEARNIQGNK